MTPASIIAIISLLQEAITVAPMIATEVQAILAKNNPTAADWEALKAKITGESFESLAPDAKLE